MIIKEGYLLILKRPNYVLCFMRYLRSVSVHNFFRDHDLKKKIYCQFFRDHRIFPKFHKTNLGKGGKAR